MKPIKKADLVNFYEYVTRDSFLYSRSFPGSGYGQFINELCQKLENGEITLEQAFDSIDKFKPSND